MHFGSLAVLMAVLVPTAIECQASAAPITTVIFSGTASQPFAFRSERATLYSETGSPILMGEAKYLETLTRNPGLKLFAWQPPTDLVLISDPGGGGALYWVKCQDIETSSLACHSVPSLDADGAVVFGQRNPQTLRGGELSARNLPNCPGDPRCP